MFEFPLAASFMGGQPVKPKRRGIYASLFDKLDTSGAELDDEQKSALVRKGLLNFGLSSLATKGQGFGGSFAQGLQGGLLSMDQGAQDIENTRYKNEILARTRAGMERNTALEAAQQGILNPDGSINDEQWGDYAALDPAAALEIRTKAQPRQAKWELKQIGDGTPGGLLDAWVNPDTQEMRDLQGNVISGGLLGQQGPQLGDGQLGAPAQPSAGLLGADVLPQLEQAVMHVESRGNPNAVSPKGARGTMQTMPETLLDPGYGVRPARDQSPAELERVGKDYLAAMLKQYGDPKLALAAYNWGPGNVDKAMKRHGGNVDAVIANSNPETRAYVPAVLGQLGQVAQAPSPMQSRIGRRPAKPAASGERQAPAGYEWNADRTALAPIPGGPAQAAIEAKAAAAEAKQVAAAAKANAAAVAGDARQNAAVESATAMIDSIDSLTEHPGFKSLGTAWGDAQLATPMIRTDVKDASSSLKSIAGRIALTTMAQLRNLSTSGATGFGALSAPELKLLQNSIESLSAEDMSNAQLVENLKIVREKMDKIRTWKPAASGVSSPSVAAPKRLKWNPATQRLE